MSYGFLIGSFLTTLLIMRSIHPHDTWVVTICMSFGLWGVSLFMWLLILMPFVGNAIIKIFFPY